MTHLTLQRRRNPKSSAY